MCEFLQYGCPGKSHSETDLLPYYSQREELAPENGITLWGYRVGGQRPVEEGITCHTPWHRKHGSSSQNVLLVTETGWRTCAGHENLSGVARESKEAQQGPDAPMAISKQPLKANPQRLFDNRWPSSAYSKWIEAVIMRSTTAISTVRELHHWFARDRLPDAFVSDNGPHFVSKEFFTFLTENGIRMYRLLPTIHQAMVCHREPYKWLKLT